MKKFAMALSATLVLSGCASEGGMTKSQQGAILGAVVGAAVGNQTGDNSRDRKRDRLTGVLVGAAAGAGVGHVLDKQEREFNEALAQEKANNQVEVQRITDEILQLTLSSEVSFDIDSATIKRSFKPSLDKLADVLARYTETDITVVGHTDSSGSEAHNQRLSVRRAQSVVSYLRRYGVDRGRMRADGKGELEPRESNSTPAGRQLNRRVEVFVQQR